MRVGARFNSILVVAAALCGCSGATHDRQVVAPQQSSQHAVRLLVTNYHHANVRVFALRGTLRHRLGVVTTNRKETFALPSYLYGTGGLIQLMVAPVGSRDTFTSELIHIREGVVVDWRVGELLHHSMVFVR